MSITMSKEPEILAHQEWLGYVQPVGLVVSIPAMIAAGAQVNRNIAPDHQRFVASLPRDQHDEIIPEIRDLPAFVTSVLGWEKTDLQDAGPLSDLHVTLPEYHETLRPTFAVKELEPRDATKPWLMLLQTLPPGWTIRASFAGRSESSAFWSRLTRVQKTPGLCGGRACVLTTRITVWGLVNSRRLGLADAQILENIVGLKPEDLQAAWDSWRQRRLQLAA
jgi:uncharacterized protein (DUF433 family)